MFTVHIIILNRVSKKKKKFKCDEIYLLIVQNLSLVVGTIIKYVVKCEQLTGLMSESLFVIIICDFPMHSQLHRWCESLSPWTLEIYKYKSIVVDLHQTVSLCTLTEILTFIRLWIKKSWLFALLMFTVHIAFNR